jgi:hypothetical protein
MDACFTIADEKMARSAIVDGWTNCMRCPTKPLMTAKLCDCDSGAIDGCQEMVKAVANAVALARQQGQSKCA